MGWRASIPLDEGVADTDARYREMIEPASIERHPAYARASRLRHVHLSIDFYIFIRNLKYAFADKTGEPRHQTWGCKNAELNYDKGHDHGFSMLLCFRNRRYQKTSTIRPSHLRGAVSVSEMSRNFILCSSPSSSENFKV